MEKESESMWRIVMFACLCERDKKKYQTIEEKEAFPFITESGHVISFIGAGGKTTLMYELAKKSAELGKKVLVTTTTHIYMPKNQYAASKEDVLNLWKQGEIAIVGKRQGIGGTYRDKLTMVSEEEIAIFTQMADLVYIEADGAKGYPCKAPRKGEPVLLPESDIVIALLGVDAFAKSIKESCFRKEIVCELLEQNEEHCLTADDLAALTISEKGLRKNIGKRDFYVVINKCDLPNDIENGIAIANEIQLLSPHIPVLLRGEKQNDTTDTF